MKAILLDKDRKIVFTGTVPVTTSGLTGLCWHEGNCYVKGLRDPIIDDKPVAYVLVRERLEGESQEPFPDYRARFTPDA